ncbi:TFIIA-alpha and beta-like factor [Centruroides sculpturatus]|uniref:TFIIA-alpha and beta-like factor n=1 Tax=Centruroides sculpturatus TaxID=218467 RepID=UPI000C6ECE59|nr:TFIIA-alpha and beta-like factor [Centruroides sculpturatus]
MAAARVPVLYRSVIEDVVANVREIFLDDGVDEQVLIELKQVWEKKLIESKAFEQRDSDPVLNSGNVVTQQSVIQRQSQVQQQTTTQINPSVWLAVILRHGIANVCRKEDEIDMSRGEGQKTVAFTMPQKVTITLPAHQISQAGLQSVVSGPTTLTNLPPEVAATLLQQAALQQGSILNTGQQQSTTLQTSDQPIAGIQYQTLISDQRQKQLVTQANTSTQQVRTITQVDGTNDTSDDEEEEDEFRDDDEVYDEDGQNEEDNDILAEEEDPLNSDDDVSEEDPSDLFDTDNVVVCQYDKITRSRNKWKFHLKDGIMNLRGRDYIFQRAMGDAEW